MRENRALLPIFILFSAVSLPSLLFGRWLSESGFDPWVLFFGNLFLLVITLASWRMLNGAMKAGQTMGFLRGFYGSFLMKFFLVAIVAFAYVSTRREAINKPSFFACMFLYLLYVFLETRALLNGSKKKGDVEEG